MLYWISKLRMLQLRQSIDVNGLRTNTDGSGRESFRNRLPDWDIDRGTIDYYYWYYGSYAMFQMAGQDWKIWKNAMVKAIVNNQITEGCLKGSWDPARDPWGDCGGRVYSTALCTLCLEVFYRYGNILGAR